MAISSSHFSIVCYRVICIILLKSNHSEIYYCTNSNDRQTRNDEILTVSRSGPTHSNEFLFVCK